MPVSGRQRPTRSAGVDWWEPLAGRYDLPPEPVFGRFDPAEGLHRLCALGHLSPRAYGTLVVAAARTHGVDVSRLTIPSTLDLFGDPQRCTSALLRTVLGGLSALAGLGEASAADRSTDARRTVLREAFDAAARQRRLDRRSYEKRFRTGASVERIAAETGQKPAVVARQIRAEIDRIILYNGLESLVRGPWSAPSPARPPSPAAALMEPASEPRPAGGSAARTVPAAQAAEDGSRCP